MAVVLQDEHDAESGDYRRKSCGVDIKSEQGDVGRAIDEWV